MNKVKIQVINTGTEVIIADSNVSINNNEPAITVDSVDEESSNTLSKRGAKVCEAIFPTFTLSQEAVEIEVIDNENKKITTATLSLRKEKHIREGFGFWTLIGATDYNNIRVPIQDRLLEPNKKGKRADLNLIALTVVIKLADIPFRLKSKEKAFNKSVDAIKTVRN